MLFIRTLFSGCGINFVAQLATPLLTLVALVVWAFAQGGILPTTWYPATVLLAIVLGLNSLIWPPRLGQLPRLGRVAIATLAAFVVWNYITMLWAQDKAAAWDGANQLLLYLVLFLLFALFRQTALVGVTFVGLWTAALIISAIVIALRLMFAADPGQFFIGQRLSEPLGYANATAAIWLMAAFSGLVLAARRELPWLLRGLFAGGVVVLAGMAILTQSRGGMIASAVTIVAIFMLIPKRIRSFAVFFPIAIAVAIMFQRLVLVGVKLHSQAATNEIFMSVLSPVLLSALVVAVIVAIGSRVEMSIAPNSNCAEKSEKVLKGAVILSAVGVLSTLLVVTGNPIGRMNRAWSSFQQGYSTSSVHQSRLASGLGSNRHDFYRVALNSFSSAPVNGVGTNNFAFQYLRERRSSETPLYPHSWELQFLSQSGLVGMTLFLCFLGAALIAAWRVMRSNGLIGAIGAASAAAVIYWVVHGSADWFIAFPALSGAAFALLGLTVGLLARPTSATNAVALDGLKRIGVWVSAVCLIGVLAVTLLPPWFSAITGQRALAAVRAQQFRSAFKLIDASAFWNPFTDQPYVTSASLDIQLGLLSAAERTLQQGLQRQPNNSYMRLQLSAIYSSRGNFKSALIQAVMAEHLNPQDHIVTSVVQQVKHQRPVSPAKLYQLYVQRTATLAH